MSESSSLKFHLELLRLIPKNYSISSLELREKLLALGIERDLRSIQRALNTLCEQFEIDCNTNDKPYSYRWKPDAKGLDMPILNEQQSLVLMLAKQYLAGNRPILCNRWKGSLNKRITILLMNRIKKALQNGSIKWLLHQLASHYYLPKSIQKFFLKLAPHFIKIDFYRFIIGVFTVKNIRHRLSHWLWYNKDQVAI